MRLCSLVSVRSGLRNLWRILSKKRRRETQDVEAGSSGGETKCAKPARTCVSASAPTNTASEHAEVEQARAENSNGSRLGNGSGHKREARVVAKADVAD